MDDWKAIEKFQRKLNGKIKKNVYSIEFSTKLNCARLEWQVGERVGVSFMYIDFDYI